jgi:hypothetical protein
MKIRIIANAHADGGGEQSTAELIWMLAQDGHDVHFHPTNRIAGSFKGPSADGRYGDITYGDSFVDETIKGKCDVLVFYANDFVYRLDQYKEKWERLMDNAGRVVVVLNFTIGHSWHDWFYSRVDQFLFLNTAKMKELTDKVGFDVPCSSLAPAVNIKPFLAINPNYGELRFVRHSRYNGKYEKSDTIYILSRWMSMAPEAEFSFMATPPFLRDQVNNKSFPKARFRFYDWNNIPVHQFLSFGSCFWYRLPQKMRDQGPRVIVEAMAAGIPVIADNRDGAKDRVATGCGWLCNHNEDYILALEQILRDPEQLRIKGQKARQHARTEFDPKKWVQYIKGEL